MNSTTKIIAGVAVLALLFAGIGFAAVTYTAQTNSTQNTVGIAYISLNEGVTSDNAKLIGADSVIAFDTVTDNNGNVTYTLDSSAFNVGHIIVDNKTTEASIKITITEKDTNMFVGGDAGRFTLTVGGETQVASYADSAWTITVPVTANTEDIDLEVLFAVKDGSTFTSTELNTLSTTTYKFEILAEAPVA